MLKCMYVLDFICIFIRASGLFVHFCYEDFHYEYLHMSFLCVIICLIFTNTILTLTQYFFSRVISVLELCLNCNLRYLNSLGLRTNIWFSTLVPYSVCLPSTSLGRFHPRKFDSTSISSRGLASVAYKQLMAYWKTTYPWKFHSIL